MLDWPADELPPGLEAGLCNEVRWTAAPASNEDRVPGRDDLQPVGARPVQRQGGQTGGLRGRAARHRV